MKRFLHKPMAARLAAFLLLAGRPVFAEEPGRLFFTPEERAALQRLRTPKAVPKPKAETRTGRGTVRASGGGSTTWDDGVPRYEPPSKPGVVGATRFKAQRGAIALAVLAILALGMLSLFIGKVDAREVRTQRDRVAAEALASARRALIGRAAADANRPGSLPCPDTDNDGVAQLFAGNECPSYVGRFPWRTLGTTDLRDGHGERLWYALSRSLRDDDSAEPVNSQTAMQLSLDGSANVAALLFSPGPPHSSQAGRPSNNVVHYLDGANADGNTAFLSGPSGDSFNDRVLALRQEDLFREVSRRVLAEMAGTGSPSTQGLIKHFEDNGIYPWADTAADADADPNSEQATGRVPYGVLPFAPATLDWLRNNDWFALAAYTVTADRSQVRLSLGSLTLCLSGARAAPCQ